jgi:predicted NBD/HSP70 family sugar kinase
MQKSLDMSRLQNVTENFIDQKSIKMANRRIIYDLLRRERILTKQEIAEKTGISFPTVSNSINHLIEKGLVEEAGTADSTGGRKPVLIKFAPNSRFAFGITIQLGGIRIIRTNIDMEMIDDFLIPMRRGETEKFLLDSIYTAVSTIIDENQIHKERILGIGIAVSGYVNRKMVSIDVAPNLGLKNITFEYLVRKLNLPLYIENEANAAALAEQRLGIAKGMKNLIYISITEGVGSGMIIDGKLYMGAHNRAGELGHQTVVSGGKTCSCGKNGCWEQYVAETVLLDEYRIIRNDKDVTLKDFFEDLSEQNPEAVQLWENYISYLTIGLHNIVSIYDPHYVVIGGNIAKYPQYLLPPLMKGVFGSSSFYVRNDTYILVSELEKDASILGAALLPMDTLYVRTM